MSLHITQKIQTLCGCCTQLEEPRSSNETTHQITQIGRERSQIQTQLAAPISLNEQSISRESPPAASSSNALFHQTLGTEIFFEEQVAQLERREILLKAGFPFTEVTEELSREALTVPVETIPYHTAANILIALLETRIKKPEFGPGSTHWQEIGFLTEKFNLDIIDAALTKSYTQFQNNTNVFAGPIFRTLLRMIFKNHFPDFQLSDSRCTNFNQTFKEYLVTFDFSAAFHSIAEQIRIIQLVFFRAPGADSNVLSQYISSSFDSFYLSCLLTIPFEAWPDKGLLITQYLEELPIEEKIKVATLFLSSPEPKMQRLGECLFNAFKAPSLIETYPFAYELFQLLPHMRDVHISWLLKVPFVSCTRTDTILGQRIFQDLPSLVGLNFSRQGKVLIYDNLVIGLHHTQGLAFDLLAFDRENHHLIWKLQCPAKPLYYQMTLLGLMIIYPKDPYIHLVDGKNGELIRKILPPAKNYSPWAFSITPSGFCYFKTEEESQQIVYGGQISAAGEWLPAFRLENMFSSFQSLGNYVYDRDLIREAVIICSQDGSTYTISNCLEIALKNGKLFTIERTPSGSIVAMQDVDESGIFQLKGPKQEFSIPIEDLQLAGICNDNSMICFPLIKQPQMLHFIDIAQRQLTHHDPELVSRYDAYYVDPLTATFYGWDCNHQQLWTHTKTATTLIGTLRSSQHTSLLHVDEKGRLYFIDGSL